MDDTHYFDEEEPISDFSPSADEEHIPPTDEEIENALRCFKRDVQASAKGYIGSAYDTTKLRRIDKEIDGFAVSNEQKEYLCSFVRAYGRKEKKRPRDKLLRDRQYGLDVLACRKRSAFLGYSWRRMRKISWRDLNAKSTERSGFGSMARDAARGRARVWRRGRLSIN